jgi:acetolactate synthase-1/2/3 large subunit
MNKIIDLLLNSKKPVILAGHGIKAAKAEKEFLQLVDHLKIPVMTTWRAMDLLEEDHYMYFGRPGLLSSELSQYIEKNCDLIICIGARMDLMQTSWNPEIYAQQAIKVVVDIDVNELNKLPDNWLKGVGDAKVFIESLLDIKVDKDTDNDFENWCNELVPIREKKKAHTESDYINLYDFVEALSEIAEEDDIIIPSSSGMASEIVQQAWKVKKGQRIICNPGLGSMGFAIPHAIGASVASNRRVIVIEGDGSLQHNIQELQTIASLDLNIKIFVINNGGYASIKNTHEKFFNNNPVSDLTFPDLEEIAKAYNINYSKMVKSNTFVKFMFNICMDYPQIIEIMIDPNQKKELI